MTTIVLLTALITAVVGVAVLWANPTRFTNQVFFGCACLLLINLTCIYQAILAGARYFDNGMSNPVPWLRLNAAFTCLYPWVLWLLCESIGAPAGQARPLLRRSLPWLIGGCLVSLVTFTDDYIPSSSRPRQARRGTGYLVASLIVLSSLIAVELRAMQQARRLVGIRKLEMQYLVLNLGLAAILSFGVAVVGNYTSIHAFKWISILLLLLTFLLAGFGIAVHRVFELRQTAIALAHRLFVVAFIAFGTIGISRLIETSIFSSSALPVASGIAALLGLIFDRAVRFWFDIGGIRTRDEIRRETLSLARSQLPGDALEKSFERLLSQHCETTYATFLFDEGAAYAASGIQLLKDVSVIATLVDGGWTTPERLQRTRPGRGRDELRQFLAKHNLGLLLAVPRSSPTPVFIIAFGTKPNAWPFTYPEIERLQNVAELMDNVLTRSRLIEQTALQARMEHLAMMSRGLAHDLKNLITPVSSFLIHTEGKYAPDSPETEVHAAARRSVRIMTEYVREALFFSERLAPKFELVSIARTFGAVIEITGPRACRRGIRVTIACDPALVVVADAVLLQRMLANFVTNAIDASPADATVTLSAASRGPDHVIVQIIDRGSGIESDHLGRIFDAYFTTKEFGDEIRGFGLGLTIARKIADLHNATIAVNSRLGDGTTFSIDLPSRQAMLVSMPAPHCAIADTPVS